MSYTENENSKKRKQHVEEMADIEVEKLEKALENFTDIVSNKNPKLTYEILPDNRIQMDCDFGGDSDHQTELLSKLLYKVNSGAMKNQTFTMLTKHGLSSKSKIEQLFIANVLNNWGILEEENRIENIGIRQPIIKPGDVTRYNSQQSGSQR